MTLYDSRGRVVYKFSTILGGVRQNSMPYLVLG